MSRNSTWIASPREVPVGGASKASPSSLSLSWAVYPWRRSISHTKTLLWTEQWEVNLKINFEKLVKKTWHWANPWLRIVFRSVIFRSQMHLHVFAWKCLCFIVFTLIWVIYAYQTCFISFIVCANLIVWILSLWICAICSLFRVY